MRKPIERRVERLEKSNIRLRRVLAAQFLVGAAILTAVFVVDSTSAARAEGETDVSAPESLTVAELIVVDERGVERVRIGSDLPDAVIDGKRVPRGTDVAGVMLYDTTGQERGGYVTSTEGNIFLTLDTRQGQVALLAAGPDGGSTVRLWHEDDAVELRSDSGGSRLTAVADGRVVFQRPRATPSEEACGQYRAALERLARDRVVAACQQRFTEEACASCLGSGEPG